MVGQLSYKVTGLQELEKKLLGLGPLVATKVGDDAVLAASKPITAAIRRLAPVKTGALRKSVTSQKTNIRETSLLSRTIGFKKPGRFYAHLVEFGHMGPNGKHVAAHPFVRPALDANAERSILEMGARLWRGIEAYCLGRILTSLDEED